LSGVDEWLSIAGSANFRIFVCFGIGDEEKKHTEGEAIFGGMMVDIDLVKIRDML